MPRSNRRRRDDPDSDALEHLISGWRRTEVRRGVEWSVQPISADQASKTYTCPHCGRDIAPGVAHVVVWRADGIMGEAAGLADRRHWHAHCWRIA